MAELVPMPLEHLVTRMVREIDLREAVFDLPLAKCFFGSREHDLSVGFHGRRASSPLGPAAGPHSQMAQNIVLAWLGGSRIIELKTVQVRDDLVIPRPCIDMRTVGYNVEWSQELRLEQSAEEYAKGAMLIAMLEASLGPRLAPGFGDTTLDMSVGYDLEGIRGRGVRRFIETMMDASKLIARLRGRLSGEHARMRDLEFPSRLSDTLTLSTFHGCPPEEIERMLEHLMREHGLNVIVKLNPTLLGRDQVDHLLHDVMGYEAVRVPRSAFAKDTTWEQACGFTRSLSDLAASLGVGFGVKLTNTLIVEHDGDFLPAGETEKYLSGPPLHVLAMTLVARFRERFGARLPISFSAGIDRRNFADAVALGLVPVTVCTDLLRTGGYARQAAYLRGLTARMDAVGARSVEQLVRAAAAAGAGGAVEAGEVDADPERAIVLAAGRYAERAARDPGYTAARNRRPPPKTGTSLHLFDCLTCDKCIPVCPNDAVFALAIPPGRLPVLVARLEAGRWTCVERGTIELAKRHQIASFADFCNDCGNCDVFCPEDGGPHVVKPRFFGSEESYERSAGGNGFLVRRAGAAVHVRGRFDGAELSLVVTDRSAVYAGAGFEVSFSLDDPAGTIAGRADPGVEVDLTRALILDLLQRSVLDAQSVNFVSCRQ